MDTRQTESVSWVGFIRLGCARFPRNTRRAAAQLNNAYLVKAEKTALIDTVKRLLRRRVLESVKAHVPLEKVDYVVCNHAEPDHSGGLPATMVACPNATLLLQRQVQGCARAATTTFPAGKSRVVKDARPFRSAARRCSSSDTPMVHWAGVDGDVPRRGRGALLDGRLRASTTPRASASTTRRTCAR
jgi:flavorubredoxin